MTFLLESCSRAFDSRLGFARGARRIDRFYRGQSFRFARGAKTFENRRWRLRDRLRDERINERINRRIKTDQ